MKYNVDGTSGRVRLGDGEGAGGSVGKEFDAADGAVNANCLKPV
jgi:hypothetical protein